MSYQILAGKTSYKGKTLKADAPSFQILSPAFAVDAENVYFLGKARDLDRQSFEILDEYFVRDRNAVYQQMETKLKTTQWDPKSFETLGHGYGRDSKGVYWTSKSLSKTDPKTFRSVHRDMAADSTGFYFQNKRIAKTRQDFSSTVKVWPREQAFWFRLGPKVYHSSSYHYASVNELESVQADSFEPLIGRYSRDVQTLYFENRSSEAPPDDNYMALDKGGEVLRGDTVCVFRGNLHSDTHRETLTECGDFFLDKEHLYHADGSIAAVLQKFEDIDEKQLLSQLFSSQWRLLEACHAIASAPVEENLQKTQLPLGVRPESALTYCEVHFGQAEPDIFA